MSLRRRLLYAVLTLFGLMTVAVAGYRILGGPDVTFLQALYMAVITLAGVGYGEIIDTGTNPALRVFNMGVVLVGVTLTVYVFSVVTAFLVEGEIRNIFRRRRMERRIEELREHYIVCGLGDTGRYAIEELLKTETPFVALDVHEENVKKLQAQIGQKEMLWLVGDAADPVILEKAGIMHARGIITALPTDKDNLVITVMARQLNPRLRIVARCADLKFSERLQKAGANSTVSPNHIGGLRMASEALRPHVVNFLDMMLKERSQTMRVEEIDIPEGGAWVGLNMIDVDLRGKYQLLPLAVKVPSEHRHEKSHHHEMTFIFNPPDTHQLTAHSVVVVMGDVHEVKRAKQDAHHKRISAITSVTTP